MKFVVTGDPVTKKNSSRIFQAGRGGRPFVAKSKAAARWETRAIRQLRKQRGLYPSGIPLTVPPERAPLNLAAKIYVDDRRPAGDMLNFLAAIADALQRAFVIENDRQILRLDGCEMLVDRENPRVEIELEPIGAAPATQVLMFQGEEHELRA
jgi:Holliday junction resolvase RusA-like endonuclease